MPNNNLISRRLTKNPRIPIKTLHSQQKKNHKYNKPFTTERLNGNAVFKPSRSQTEKTKPIQINVKQNFTYSKKKTQHTKIK
jgi:hypothetical protein